MAKKQKEYWYVLVFTDTGPVYVTGLEGYHEAQCDRLKPPKEMSEAWAKNVSLGLGLNGFGAVPVASPYELDNQPYRYDSFTFTAQKITGEDE